MIFFLKLEFRKKIKLESKGKVKKALDIKLFLLT